MLLLSWNSVEEPDELVESNIPNDDDCLNSASDELKKAYRPALHSVSFSCALVIDQCAT